MIAAKNPVFNQSWV